MKRGIIATVILLCCIVSALIVNSTLEHKIEKLYNLAQSVTNKPYEFTEFENEWEKQTLFFSLFTDHNSFEEIDKQTAKIKYLDGELYYDACVEITADLATLKKKFSYSFPNIF